MQSRVGLTQFDENGQKSLVAVVVDGERVRREHSGGVCQRRSERGREVPYAWRRRRRDVPRGLLRTDSPSARSRTTTVRPKKRACVEETTPPKTERASPVVFCSTLRCEARFSIGRLARKLCRETPLRRGLRPGKTRLKKIQRAVALAWLLQGQQCSKDRNCCIQSTSRRYLLTPGRDVGSRADLAAKHAIAALRAIPLRLRAHRCRPKTR